jgi:hypothetical protein
MPNRDVRWSYCNAVRIADKKEPGVLAGSDDHLIAVPRPHAEFVAAKIVSDILHRIEFW